MIIYISMIIWVLVTGIIFYRDKKYYRKSDGSLALTADIYPYIAMSVIVIFMGLRSGVADTSAYINGFENMPVGMDNLTQMLGEGSKGPCFTLMEMLIKTYISEDFHVFLFVIALIEGVLVSYAISKFSKYSRASMILFMLTTIYTWMLNGIRQFMAVTIIFAALNLLVEKKYVKYILVVLFAATFHSTAIIMLPMCFIVDGKPWNKKTLFVLLTAIGVIFFASEFTNILGGALEGTAYEGATEQFANDDGVNPIRVLVNAIPVIFAFINRKAIERINSRTINTLINLSLIGVGVSLVGMATSGILIGRLAIYFTIFNLILLPWIINETFGKNKLVGILAMYLFYTGYFFIGSANIYISDVLNIYIMKM